MPLGYYLAQGLIPLTASSSDDEEGPCVLPDGRTVCGPHGLVICGRCCTDYSFLNEEVLSQDSDDAAEEDSEGSDSEADFIYEPTAAGGTARIPAHSFGPALRRGTGLVFPTKFVPPSAQVTPIELFSGRKTIGLITRQVIKTR